MDGRALVECAVDLQVGSGRMCCPLHAASRRLVAAPRRVSIGGPAAGCPQGRLAGDRFFPCIFFEFSDEVKRKQQHKAPERRILLSRRELLLHTRIPLRVTRRRLVRHFGDRPCTCRRRARPGRSETGDFMNTPYLALSRELAGSALYGGPARRGPTRRRGGVTERRYGAAAPPRAHRSPAAPFRRDRASAPADRTSSAVRRYRRIRPARPAPRSLLRRAHRRAHIR